MEDQGLRLIFSSDAPIELINPMEGIQTAVTRKDFNDSGERSWYPQQCLSLESALKGYFEHGAWTAGKGDPEEIHLGNGHMVSCFNAGQVHV